MNDKLTGSDLVNIKVFCKDCKHLREVPGKSPEFWKCEKAPPLNASQYFVTGSPDDLLGSMGYATCARMPSQCGPEAAWFEQRDRDAGLLPPRVEATCETK